GARIPSEGDDECGDLRRASIMMLLKPWRRLTDLKDAGQTWESAYDMFMLGATTRDHRVIAGLQYFHDC
ncbi:uncharacterized protein SCHCODRAFT_02481063, partial [Schizophyllum commune H4-8]|uniref:uncharacterized protein n=1 Tax=Schizophyllum commune (strain H4-8 / FGSC 9210) TaxID=578458 RepID=UPI00215E5F33